MRWLRPENKPPASAACAAPSTIRPDCDAMMRAGNRVERRQERVLSGGELSRRQTGHVRDQTGPGKARRDVLDANGHEEREQIVAAHGEPREHQIAQRARECTAHERTQDAVPRHRKPAREHAHHRHHHAEDLPDFGNFHERESEVEIERIHDVQHEVGNPVHADERRA